MLGAAFHENVVKCGPNTTTRDILVAVFQYRNTHTPSVAFGLLPDSRKKLRAVENSLSFMDWELNIIEIDLDAPPPTTFIVQVGKKPNITFIRTTT